MAKRIAALEAGGIAEQLGLREGDVLFSINGEAVLDTIDYQALTYETHIELSTSRGDFSFDKEEYEPLGVWLEADGVRPVSYTHLPFSPTKAMCSPRWMRRFTCSSTYFSVSG